MKDNKGFTIIELLGVIIVLIAITLVAVPSITSSVERNKNKLAIFAGACQSYYEEIMNAGANFASSPGRIFIDFFSEKMYN